MKKTFSLFLFFMLIGLLFVPTSQGQEEMTEGNFIMIIDGMERRTVEETTLIEQPSFFVFQSHDRVRIEYRDLDNESLVYEERVTTKNVIELRTRYNAELIIYDQEDNIIQSTIIRERTLINRARYYEFWGGEEVVTMTFSFIFAGTVVFGYFWSYDKEEW